MCKPLHAGKGAQNGALAAILANGGFTAPREILEGPFGFGKVYAPQKFDEAQITLRDKFKIDEVLYKRYASCYYTHSTISCVMELCRKYHPAPADVASIEVKVFPMAIQIAGKLAPKTGLEGKFSVRCCAAMAFIENNALESQFTDAKVNSPAIQGLMSKVSVVPDEKLNELKRA